MLAVIDVIAESTLKQPRLLQPFVSFSGYCCWQNSCCLHRRKGKEEEPKKMSTCGKQKREKLHGRQEGTGSLSSFAATKPITSVLDLQIRSGISILSALQIENTPG